MLYYLIELHDPKPDEAEEKSTHPSKRGFAHREYTDNSESMNSRFFNEFLTKEDILFFISDAEDGEMQVCAAFKAGAYTDGDLEEVLKRFPNCKLVSFREATVEEFKSVIENSCYGVTRKVLRKLKLDYRSNGLFDPCPYTWTEQVLDLPKITSSECGRLAEKILASQSLTDELERIYSPLNKMEYYGHPVHYYISSGEWGAAQDIYELLIRALGSNGRLCSNRVSVFREFKRGAYRDERLRQHFEASESGIIILELCCDSGMTRYATEQYELVKLFGKMIEEMKKDTLFIVVEIMGKSVKNADVLGNLISKADFIQLTDGAGTYERAAAYLAELAERSDITAEDPKEALSYLPKQESFSVSDIFRAYNTWYGSGLKNHIYKAYKKNDLCRVEVHEPDAKPYETLKALVGLTEAKSVIESIIAAGKVKRIREQLGLKPDSLSLNMMFTGNPGTAKTTVARLVAEILKEEDIIRTGRMVECGRQDLVARYVGWTAKTIEEKFRQAEGGVLFIDEAYSLVEDDRSFATEAIDTITQLMENYRDRVIVIFAGYPDKMEQLLEKNEGLRSRISFHLNFPDYSSAELADILTLHASAGEYVLSEGAVAKCRTIFDGALKKENFGNGRYTRNLLEQAIIRHANRVMQRGGEITAEDVCLLDADDFKPVSVGFTPSEAAVIGFSAVA